jgi:membrane peptidoglycan carboxypeptidase
MNRNSTGIILTDRNDVPFFTFYSAHKKTFVPLADIPDSVKSAVIAAEDKNFYNHPGFSLEGIVRAAFRNVSEQDVVAGGSTITQQLVKNSLLTPERNFLRKFQENDGTRRMRFWKCISIRCILEMEHLALRRQHSAILERPPQS